MGEMEDKLNAILNDPSAMGQIMALAQSLGGGAPRPQASPAGEAAQGAEQTGAREAEAPLRRGALRRPWRGERTRWPPWGRSTPA